MNWKRQKTRQQTKFQNENGMPIAAAGLPTIPVVRLGVSLSLMKSASILCHSKTKPRRAQVAGYALIYWIPQLNVIIEVI